MTRRCWKAALSEGFKNSVYQMPATEFEME
jgi:hypothetical protein